MYDNQNCPGIETMAHKKYRWKIYMYPEFCIYPEFQKLFTKSTRKMLKKHNLEQSSTIYNQHISSYQGVTKKNIVLTTEKLNYETKSNIDILTYTVKP